MNDSKILDVIQSCVDCKVCNDECDTFEVTQDPLKSPYGRLKIAEKVFTGDILTNEELIAIYTCTSCSSCDLVCPQDIPISEMIHASKTRLVELDQAPLDVHKNIIKGILEKGNSVNGNPEERLDWLPENYKNNELFEDKESDTLLFLGCMSSFRVKESASASYEILKRGGYDFKILRNEPCCGEYIYSAGNLELSKQIFNENFALFKKHGIKTLIVTCGGCLYAFNNIYPKYVENFDINVKHVVQIIRELEEKGKIQFKPANNSVTYHDACRTGRKIKGFDVYEEPRELLEKTNTKVKELTKNKENTKCCGAGSGIRGVDSGLSIKIGTTILKESKSEEIISSCPLCVFNYRYVAYKTQNDKKTRYITDYLFDALL